MGDRPTSERLRTLAGDDPYNSTSARKQMRVMAEELLEHREGRGCIEPERLRAVIRLLGPQEMTPTAERFLTALADHSCPNDTDGDGNCGRRNCLFCGQR